MITAPERTVPRLTLGWRLRMARAHAGMSTQQAADALGTARAVLYRWEADDRTPRLDIIARASDIYGVPLDWLVEGVR